MDRRTWYIVIGVIVLVLILGYALGWFGGGEAPVAGPDATPAPGTTPAPAQ